MSDMFLPISFAAENTRIRVMTMAIEPTVDASSTSSLVNCSKIEMAIVFHLAEYRMMVTLLSVISVENTRILPARIQGAIRGTVTLRMVQPQVAPQIADASSILVSTWVIDADTERKI